MDHDKKKASHDKENPKDKSSKRLQENMKKIVEASTSSKVKRG